MRERISNRAPLIVVLLVTLVVIAIVIGASLLRRPPEPPQEVTQSAPTIEPTATAIAAATSQPTVTSVEVCGHKEPMNILIILIGDLRVEGSDDALAIRVGNADFPDESGGVITFPRELQLPVAGLGGEQLSLEEIFNRGSTMEEGASLVAQTLEDQFNMTIDYSLIIDLDQLANLIDDLGGVEVKIRQPYDARAYGLIYFEPGTMLMSGDLALAYATAADSGSIWNGLARQTEVILGIGNRILTAGIIPRIPELFTKYHNLITTDLSLMEALSLGCLFESLDLNSVTFTMMEEVTPR